jgi:hypothetical protein
LIQQARVEPAAELPTGLIEAKPPQAPESVPAPAPAVSARTAATPKKEPAPQPAKLAAAAKPAANAKKAKPAAKAQAKADAAAQPRRSSAEPRSDVPTHRPPAQRGLDTRAIGIGALLLVGVAVFAMVSRDERPPETETVSAEPAAQPPLSAPPATAAPAQTFELHLSTLPSEANVTVGQHSGKSPLTLQLGGLTSALEVRVEKEGFESLTSSVELGRFLEMGDGKRVATVMLALPPLPRDVAGEQTNVSAALEAKAPEAAAAPAPAAAAPEKVSAVPAPEKTRAARSIAAKRATPKPETTATPVETAAAAAPTPPPAAPAPAPVAAAPAPAPAPAAPPATPPSAEPEPVAAPKPAIAPLPPPSPAGGLTPMQAARACLARNDQACAVAALENRARTAQELELLIETSRSMGRTDQVKKHMKLYLERYPSERRAAAYSAQLGVPAPQ